MHAHLVLAGKGHERGAAGRGGSSLLSDSQVGTLRRTRNFTNVNETGTNADGVKQYQIDCIISL